MKADGWIKENLLKKGVEFSPSVRSKVKSEVLFEQFLE